ncbi:hypothetical protein C8Q72DRAFT_500278 [Fomitopsis betulina]|nr:hypothetical protein C8Q72DRAFT_500278 [Fomitopsis betulina]
MPTVRELEDLIIDAIYLSIIRGKLDQKEQQFDVEYTVGRDVEQGKIEALLASLKSWADTTSAVLSALDEKLAALATEAVQAKKKQDAYDHKYQSTLKEVIDKQKAVRAANKPAITGQTGLTAAGIAERDRQRERERQEREEQERRQKEKEQAAKGDDNEENDSMDVDDPPEGGKGKKKAPPQDAQRGQRKRNRP